MSCRVRIAARHGGDATADYGVVPPRGLHDERDLGSWSAGEIAAADLGSLARYAAEFAEGGPHAGSASRRRRMAGGTLRILGRTVSPRGRGPRACPERDRRERSPRPLRGGPCEPGKSLDGLRTAPTSSDSAASVLCRLGRTAEAARWAAQAEEARREEFSPPGVRQRRLLSSRVLMPWEDSTAKALEPSTRPPS